MAGSRSTGHHGGVNGKQRRGSSPWPVPSATRQSKTGFAAPPALVASASSGTGEADITFPSRSRARPTLYSGGAEEAAEK